MAIDTVLHDMGSQSQKGLRRTRESHVAWAALVDFLIMKRR